MRYASMDASHVLENKYEFIIVQIVREKGNDKK